ncbi:MAG: hypothetical protein WA833_03915 [Nitrosotalea sp.]
MHTRLVLLILSVGLACVVILYANALSTNSSSVSKENNGLVVRTNSSVALGYDSHAQISCNDGEILTGGGYQTNFKDGLSVYQNGPSEDGKQWIVSARYTAGSAAGGSYRGLAPPLEIYGMCMKSLP